MTYEEYISQFEILENPPIKKGFHRHHIVPISEQVESDNRQIYVTPAQHLWCHILYDKEHDTRTSDWLRSFTHKTIEYFDCFEKCLAYSDIYDKQYRKNVESNSGMNSAMYGKHLTEETRKKISESLKGHEITEESRKRMSESRKGRHHTDETKKKISEANTGRIFSEEHRHNISLSKQGDRNPWKGHHHTEEAKKRMSEIKKGNTATKGTRWWNNGQINKMSKEQPGPEWERGRLSRGKTA